MMLRGFERRGRCFAALLTVWCLNAPAWGTTLVDDASFQSLASMRPSGEDVTVPEGTVGWPGARYPTSPPLHALRAGTAAGQLYGGFQGMGPGPQDGLLSGASVYSAFGLYAMQASVSVYERLAYDEKAGLFGRINGTPVLARDGKMYVVMTSVYGETATEEDDYHAVAVGRGVIVRLDDDGTHPEPMQGTRGALFSPNGTLVEGADDRLYGMDKGPSGGGRIYALDIASGALSTIHEFVPAPDWAVQIVNDLAVGQDGWLFGVTAYHRGLLLHPNTPNALTTPTGTLFRIEPTQPGSFQVLHTFTLAEGEINTADNVTDDGLRYYPSGEQAVSGQPGDVTYRTLRDGSQYGLSTVLDAGDGYLYGNLSIGDCYVYHRFSVTPSGLVTISSNHPLCGFRGAPIEASQYPFYDGPRPFGAIYRIARDGTGPLQIVHAFDGTDGATPRGPLAVGKDGRIYGTTLSGGSHICRQSAGSSPWLDVGCGTVFRIDPTAIRVDDVGAIASAGFASVHHFEGGDGRMPLGLHAGDNGNLYGVTSMGGGYYDLSGQFVQTDYGTVFQLRVGTDGSSQANASLVAERAEIREGDTATLTWLTSGARDCRISSSSNVWDADVAPFGSHSFHPPAGTHRFTLTCFVEGGAVGEQVSALTSLSVGVPATAEDENSVSYGNGGALSWFVLVFAGLLACRRRACLATPR